MSNNSSFITTKLYTDVHVQIIKLACFENDQLHAIFNDNSTLIVYPYFIYAIYFHNDNQMFKFKVTNPLKLNNIGFKIYQALNIYNLFNDKNITPEITLSYTEIFEKDDNLEKFPVLSSSELITKAYWINEESYFELGVDYYLINSHDFSSKFYFFKNKRIAKIEFPLLCASPPDNTTCNEYKYLKAVKFYLIDNMPSLWNVPFNLLINYFNISGCDSSKKIDMNSAIITYKEFSSNLPIISSHEVNTCKSIFTNKNIINPIAFVYNNESNLKFMFTQNFTYLMNKSEVEIISNEYPNLINFSTNSMTILNYQIKDDLTEVKSLEVESYVKLLHHNKRELDTISELVLDIYEINKYWNNRGIEISQVITNTSTSSTSKTIHHNQHRNNFIFDGDEVVYFKVLKKIGEFYGFKNKAVKIIFVDRTILKIESTKEKISIINKDGNNFVFAIERLDESFSEFLFYYDYAIQFYNFCYLAYNEKKEILNNLEFISEVSKTSINRINTMKTLNNYQSKSIVLSECSLESSSNCELLDSSVNNYDSDIIKKYINDFLL